MNNPSLSSESIAQLHAEPSQGMIRCSIDIAASPSDVYAIWSDVENWHLWDPDTRWARLDGPFVAGSFGRIAPQKGFSAKMQLIEATTDQSFTVACPVMGSQMLFEHRMHMLGEKLRVTHEVRFSGWLKGFLIKVVGTGLIKGMPVTMQSLRALCQARASSQQLK